jgi:hypothetical protein
MSVVPVSRQAVLRVLPQAPLSASDLADYEEGTYTPVLSSTGGSNLSGNFNATYVRVGATVTINMYLDINSIAGASGSLRVSVPFQPSGATFQFIPIYYGETDPTNNNDAVGSTTNCNGMFLRLGNNNSTVPVIVYRNFNTAGGPGVNTNGFRTFLVTANTITSAAIWYVSGSYTTNGLRLL